MNQPRHSRPIVRALMVLVAMACLPYACDSAKGTDSQTNWLSLCGADADCANGLQCICGACTATCAQDCRGLGSGASCVTIGASASTRCTPPVPAGGVCSLPCTTHADCTGQGSWLRCVGGACLAPSVSTDGGIVGDSSPSAGGKTGTGGATSSGAGGNAGTGGATSSGGQAGAAPDPAPTMPLMISVGNFVTGVGIGSAGSNAMLIGFLPPRCVTKQFETCTVFDCRVRRDGGLAGLTGISAGVITISGGSGADVVLTPDKYGVYPIFKDSSVTRWHTGDSLQISAAGDTVPAFSATLSFPNGGFAFAEGGLPEGGEPEGGVKVWFTGSSVVRGTGAAVTWVPTDETVTVGAVQLGPDGATWDLIQGYCDFPGSAGGATLPAEFFADFTPGQASSYGAHSHVTTVTAGLHPVRLQTINDGGGSGDSPIEVH